MNHHSKHSQHHPTSSTTSNKQHRDKHFASVDHLSLEAIAAYVDEELSVQAMHRARIHLVHCAECRDEIRAQRAASEKLKELNTDTMTAPSALLAKLNSIATSCPAGPSAEDCTYAKPETLLDRVDLMYRAVVRHRGTK